MLLSNKQIGGDCKSYVIDLFVYSRIQLNSNKNVISK